MKYENLNLTALKYYIDAYENQSITQSALLNHVSRPAVSQAIIRLGEYYGQKLLKHEKKQFITTDAGKEFYKIGKEISLNISQSFQNKLQNSKYELRIGASISVLDFIFPRIESFISKSHNPIIKIGKTNDLIDLVSKDKISLAFVVDTGQNRHHNSVQIASGQFQIYSKNGKINNTLITTEARSEVKSFLKYCKSKDIQFKNKIQVESWSAAIKLSQLGFGCCLIPDFISNTLVPNKSMNFNLPYSVLLLTKKEREMSLLELELFKFLYSSK